MAIGNLASRFLVAFLIGPLIVLAMYQDRHEFFWGIVFGGSAIGMWEFFSMSIEDKTDRQVSLLFGICAVAALYWLPVGGVLLAFFTAVVFAVVKVAAVAVTFAGRMGGGVFSPSLMLGALTGCAFGELVIAIFPTISGSQGLYALAGMGAVAGAVLGAPISSTLIVFELTGDWQAGIAVMITVSLASVVSGRMVARSFFLTLLERRGLHLSGGPQGYIAATMPVAHKMRHRGAEDCASDTACWALVEQGAYLRREDTLETALPIFERLRGGFLPVVDGAVGENAKPELLGALFQTDALGAYSRALEDELREEHG
jgi:CIC family chloride channel protein